jgi:hypothetical protein
MDEALHLLNFGEEFRVSSSYFEKYRVTDYNSHSSRSHTIYKVYVEASTSTAKGGKKTTFSCLVAKTLFKNLVDLAGSERLSVNLDSEENDKETKFINKSLFYLTKVIFMLSTGNQ